MKEIKFTVNKKILTLALVGVAMVCCSCLMYVYDPLSLIVRKVTTVEPGTLFFQLWQQPPYSPTLKLYIFNVTNPEQFLNGDQKLGVVEIGPYCYTELLTNENATFNADDGTVTFSPNRVYAVDPECSVGDATVDRVLVPNVPLLGIQSFLTEKSMFTQIGFSTLSATVGAEGFVNITVDEFLWGYTDKLVTMANQFIPSWIDFGKFGIVERLISRDNNNEATVTVDPKKTKSRYSNVLSEEDIMTPFHLTKWGGLEGLPEWGYIGTDEAIASTKKCQLIEGTFDGTFYPHPLTERNLTLFRKAFCRPVLLNFAGEGVTGQGYKSFNFKMPKNMFASPDENEYNECFCFNGKCPGKGLQTIAPCYYDIPIVLSQPHFLNSPPEVVESVVGMYPDEDKHNSLMKLQPDVGVALDGSALRIQVNVEVGQTRFNTKTRPFNGLTLPLLWIELSLDIMPGYVLFLLNLILDYLPIGQKIFIYLLGIVGLAFISGAALLTLFFTKTNVPRSLSIPTEYAPIPLITLPTQYFKEKEREKYEREKLLK